jgi:hypothetical protein
MKVTRSMITVAVGFCILALTSTLAAQPSVPSKTKLQRTDRNFIQKAAAEGLAESSSGDWRKKRPPATRSSSSRSAWSRTMEMPTRS